MQLFPSQKKQNHDISFLRNRDPQKSIYQSTVNSITPLSEGSRSLSPLPPLPTKLRSTCCCQFGTRSIARISYEEGLQGNMFFVLWTRGSGDPPPEIFENWHAIRCILGYSFIKNTTEKFYILVSGMVTLKIWNALLLWQFSCYVESFFLLDI